MVALPDRILFLAGMSIDANTGAIQWVPSEIQAGQHGVHVVVSDGRGGVAEQTFAVAVAESLSVAPVISSLPLLNGREETLYSYTVSASDADQDPLVFRLLQSPAGMAIDSVNGNVTWMPAVGQAGVHDVSISVLGRRGRQADQAWQFTVRSLQNMPPVFVSTPPSETVQDQLYTYDVQVQDPDGDHLLTGCFLLLKECLLPMG